MLCLTTLTPLHTHTHTHTPPPALPPLAGCALNFLLHSSSKAKSSYANPHPHTHTHTHTHTHSPRNSSVEQYNVESSEGSEVFSWAKPPQLPSDELILPKVSWTQPTQSIIPLSAIMWLTDLYFLSLLEPIKWNHWTGLMACPEQHECLKCVTSF